MNRFETRFSAIYRPSNKEITFLSTIEPNFDVRPLILIFVIDASHSMRFYIDSAKTIQRQTLVQTALEIALNTPSIVRDSDYVGLVMFSSEARHALPSIVIPITPDSRNELNLVVTKEVKSDGGQTNYGKALELVIQTFKDLEAQFGSNSPLLAGPILIWFLTDGKPWPSDPGNREQDILQLAKAIGVHGHEFWAIGISSEASQDFLEKISTFVQQGQEEYQKSLEGVPKEFLRESKAKNQTFWLDITAETHERLVYGLLNAIEHARVNLGIVVEINVTFQILDSAVQLEFATGTTAVKREGNEIVVQLKRPQTIEVGKKLTAAFAVSLDNSDLITKIMVENINYQFYRGEQHLETTTEHIGKPLGDFAKTNPSVSFGGVYARNSLWKMKKQIEDQTKILEGTIMQIKKIPEGLPREITEKLAELEEYLRRHRGLALPSAR